MAAIDWDENLPSQSSDATLVDDEIRSMLTNIATGLGESIFWPGSATTTGGHSGASIGELRPGSARLALPDTTPIAHDEMPDGFLGLQLDNARLWHLGSSQNTYVISGGDMLVAPDNPGSAPYTARWVLQEGTVTETTDGDDAITFATAYNGVPFVTVSRGDSQALSMNFGPISVTTAGFTLRKLWVGSGATQASTFVWRSEGTIDL